MRKGISMLLLVLSALFSMGCASGPTYSSMVDRIPAIPAGEGRIYFYRPSAIAAALQPSIRLDERVVGKSISKGFLFHDCAPGEYTVSTSTLLEHARAVTVREGQTTYVKLFSSVGLLAGHIIPQVVTEATALSGMRGLSYVGSSDLLESPR